MFGVAISASAIALAVCVSVVGGLAKGLTGLGVQALSIPALALVVPLEIAIGLGIAPAFSSSLYQAFFIGKFKVIWRRTLMIVLPCCATLFLGTAILANVDRVLLAGVLGIILCIYALYALSRPALPPIGGKEPWLSPIIGAITGIAGGATGMFIMPAAPYFQLLGFRRDELVQAVSLAAVIVMPILAFALNRNNLITQPVGLISLALVVPTFVGLYFGARLRERLSEVLFRKLFVFMLLLLGIAITARNFF